MVMLCVLLASCGSSKKIAYMQSIKTGVKGTSDNVKSIGSYDVRFKSKDLLAITVVTSEPDASRNYNLLVPQLSESTGNLIFSSPTMQTYLVDNEGCIDFPILGKIVVAGYTRKELEDELQKKLKSSFSKERPIITIRITNYSVNFLGEVSRPGKYFSSNDRMTIFEGLSMAGDMTIYGKRENVKVLREKTDGSKMLLNVNLYDENILNSPAYFLEQNDVVYVEPNKSRTRSANINAAETLSVSALSIAISLASLLVNILR